MATNSIMRRFAAQSAVLLSRNGTKRIVNHLSVISRKESSDTTKAVETRRKWKKMTRSLEFCL